ncbi:hypothetical protein COO60DRAFT_1543020 [Scenedesmus sp. NREL 46B-D3]|nr:hypothetical protein COO60DRAFT_1543020 [Scenedesmus sp. NREL 46B-D3]
MGCWSQVRPTTAALPLFKQQLAWRSCSRVFCWQAHLALQAVQLGPSRAPSCCSVWWTAVRFKVKGVLFGPAATCAFAVLAHTTGDVSQIHCTGCCAGHYLLHGVTCRLGLKYMLAGCWAAGQWAAGMAGLAAQCVARLAAGFAHYLYMTSIETQGCTTTVVAQSQQLCVYKAVSWNWWLLGGFTSECVAAAARSSCQTAHVRPGLHCCAAELYCRCRPPPLTACNASYS